MKGSTSDRAVGPLRYVRWVCELLEDLEGVGTNAEVEGWVIVSEPSEKLEYVISAVPELTMYEYDMKVILNQST